MSTIYAILDAVKQRVDVVVASLNLEIQSIRRLAPPSFKLSELSTPRISIVPATTESSPISRASDQREYTVGILTQIKLTAPDSDQAALDAELSSNMQLVELIFDSMNRVHLDAVNLKFASIKHEPIVSIEHYEALRVFESLISVTYQAFV